MSAIGVGCANLGRIDEKQARDVIHAAIDHGINFFDVADSYGGIGGAEEILGRAIRGRDRSKLVIATKFSDPMSDNVLIRGGSRRYIIEAVENNLRRLQLDYIDLYQQHVTDPSTPLEESLRALDDLVHQGKIRYFGCSNYRAWQISDAAWTAKTNGLNRYVTTQTFYSLLARGAEREIFAACETHGMGVLPYFPLARGMLSGEVRRGDKTDRPPATMLPAFARIFPNDQNFDVVERLEAYAQGKGRTLLELALAWLVSQPVISCIIAGATTTEHIRNNVDALGWHLSPEEIAEVDKLSTR